MGETLSDIEVPKTGKITYNIHMAKAIRAVKPPYKGILVDVRLRPNWLALVIHEHNIMEYSVDQRVNIMEYLLMMRSIIESYGVRCELEGISAKEKKS
jgi:hypothetical protein